MRAAKSATAAVAIALSSIAGTAQADGWILRVGGHYVEPKTNNHSIVNVDPSESLTFDINYQHSPHWGVELLAALPFQHDIDLNADGSRVAKVKQLPPTLTVQYNFRPDAKVRPYLGLGANATLFFDERTRGALAGTDLRLRNSVGAAAQVGLDVDVSKNWFLTFDARWIDIDTRAKLSGTDLGMVHIEPVTYGLSFGHRFGGR
ncbi:MAG TPA: OmpW family outer membrane protein [Steroidobacteraceae bacterium]|nr:OmpW family outer membrane protein [Steroidobacteraceae bacterium]